MNLFQPGILADVPAQARYLTFSIKPASDPRAALENLSSAADGESVVVGVGTPLTEALGIGIDGLQALPAYEEAKVAVPSTPSALWLWLRDEDRGNLVHLSRKLTGLLESSFDCDSVIDGFRYGTGRDLTGYDAVAVKGACRIRPAGRINQR